MGGTKLRPRDWKSFLAGAALGVVAAKLFPIIKQGARPAARGLIAGAIELGYKTRTMAAQAREELDNLVAEARFAQVDSSAGALPGPPPETNRVSEHGPDTLT